MGNSALGGGERSNLFPCCFSPRKRASYKHWTGDWVGPRANLDVVAMRKINYLVGNQIPVSYTYAAIMTDCTNNVNVITGVLNQALSQTVMDLLYTRFGSGTKAIFRVYEKSLIKLTMGDELI
jgi:hypothetical protein